MWCIRALLFLASPYEKKFFPIILTKCRGMQNYLHLAKVLIGVHIKPDRSLSALTAT